MRRMFAMVLPATLLIAAPPAGGQLPFRKVFSSDTMIVLHPTISPDGQWLVFVRRIDNHDSRLMIQPLPTGQARELTNVTGTHSHPRFAPKGDRLFFVSTMPQRSATDEASYLVAATFDTRTGTLSGPPRQVALDELRINVRSGPVMSPDGQWVAYVDDATRALRVIPSAGGNARTLAEGSARLMPAWFGWSTDSRFVTYEARTGEKVTRFRVGVDGGAPVPVETYDASPGIPSPDGRYFANIAGGQLKQLQLFGPDGALITSVPSLGMALHTLSFSLDGKYLIGSANNTTAATNLVSLTGGPIRKITQGESYEWPGGWSEDGHDAYVQAVQNGQAVVLIVGTDGAMKRRIPVPEGAVFVAMHGETMLYRQRVPGRSAANRLFAVGLDGKRRQLTPDLVAQVCCDVVGPGGMYYGMYGDELYTREISGSRLHIRALRIDGSARLIADLPSSFVGKTGYAVFKDRVVFTERDADSLRLQMMTGPRGAARTLASFPAATPLGEFVWSHDGRQLSLYINGQPWKLLVFRFDAAGRQEGPPRGLDVPVEYAYETFWLPDGSGMTMIAQPRGSSVSEVALVKLNDPEHPIFLTKNDSVSKWGHALSPDGKYVSYPSERQKGSSIYLIEVAELLKSARK